MNKTFGKIIINFYGSAFIVAAAAAVIVMHTKAIGGVLVLLIAGAALLRRKVFGVYTVLFLALVMGGMGLLIAGLALNDILHKLYKFDLLFIGLVPVILSLLTAYFFTRRAVAEEFGLSKIAIVEKVDRKELIATVKILLWIAGIIGLVLLACYVVVMVISR